jgi:hypothetical protein
MPKKIEIKPGTVFNKLTYIHDVERTDSNRRAMFRCECGIEKALPVHSVRTGKYIGCGCEKNVAKHGHCVGGVSSLHKRWGMMKYRCDNPTSQDYHRYGGRGIKVCPEWYNFEVFAQWAKDSGYVKHLTLDRRNNDKGYSPSNCRWVSLGVQCANQSKAKGTINQHIGVRQIRSGNWHAVITHGGKQIAIGTYPTEEMAVAHRDGYIINNKLPHTLSQLANKEVVKL